MEVLHKADFSVDKSGIMGLCGENGAGKSTLMKILAGIHLQDAGDVIFEGNVMRRNAAPQEMQRVGVSMIHQELNLLNELSVAQNIYLCREPRGASGLINFNRMNEDAEKILSTLGEKIDPRRRVRDPEDRAEADGGDRQGHLLQRGAARHGRADLGPHG